MFEFSGTEFSVVCFVCVVCDVECVQWMATEYPPGQIDGPRESSGISGEEKCGKCRRFGRKSAARGPPPGQS